MGGWVGAQKELRGEQADTRGARVDATEALADAGISILVDSGAEAQDIWRVHGEGQSPDLPSSSVSPGQAALDQKRVGVAMEHGKSRHSTR